MGLTETASRRLLESDALDAPQVGSVGRASGCEARVVDAERRDAARRRRRRDRDPRPERDARLLQERRERTAAAFTPDGWLRTGDLGHRDADGFFFVTGRIKELIIKGGENIAPREIDEALLAHPAVLEAAAVGVPDRHYGQEIVACIVLARMRAATEEELREPLRSTSSAATRRRRFFRFVAELPRGPSGKVQRLAIAEAWTKRA